jgi:hypothetical protein
MGFVVHSNSDTLSADRLLQTEEEKHPKKSRSSKRDPKCRRNCAQNLYFMDRYGLQTAFVARAFNVGGCTQKVKLSPYPCPFARERPSLAMIGF